MGEVIGIDVGGRRKGFHVCALSGRSLTAGPLQIRDPAAVIAFAEGRRPDLVAIDSPRSCAPAGETSRAGERALNRKVCGIRWTPARSALAGNPYYEWIVCGLELYRLFERSGTEVIEVFPTASWTRWAGPRQGASRARWSREALLSLGIECLPTRRLNQDDRDSIAAAVTARQHGEGETECFDPIVVPDRPPPGMKVG